MATVLNRTGTIFKKCDRKNHKPNSNKRCADGACQHTCDNPEKCPHAWTVRYSVNSKQREASFHDEIRNGRIAGAGVCVWLMRGCGLRIEEALAVSKEDFIEDGAILRVMWQASRDGSKRMPLKHRKQGEYRDIPVPSWLWEMVKDAPQGPLTPGLNGKLFKSYQVTFGRFKNAARARHP